MAWWRRRPGADRPDDGRSDDDRPDPELPPLTTGQAARLRAVARAAFAEAGLETVPDGAVLRGLDGRVLGLTNVARLAALTPEDRWSALLAQHARTMVTAAATPAPDGLDEVRDRLYLRLLTAGDVPADAAVRSVGGGLVAAVAVDHPEHVATLTRSDALEGLGGWDAVAEVGLANLRALRAQRTSNLVDDATGAVLHVSAGGFFHASRVLVLPTVLAEDFRLEEPAHGVLVAAPHRHLLAVHAVVGVDEVLVTLRRLAGLARGERSGPGPLSEDVFFWRDGVLQRVTTWTPDGTLQVDGTGAFGQAMTEVGLPG